MSNTYRNIIVAALTLLCSLWASAARLQTGSQSAPDNSKQNQNHTQTAQNQSSAAADRDTTAKIRRAIIADKGLSMYAHNVKIITKDGQVTLKGPVKSEDEKKQVESDAVAVVSAGHVANQLTVK